MRKGLIQAKRLQAIKPKNNSLKSEFDSAKSGRYSQDNTKPTCRKSFSQMDAPGSAKFQPCIKEFGKEEWIQMPANKIYYVSMDFLGDFNI
jgi:hypothetical protein